MSINKLFLTGTLTKDCKLYETKNGLSYTQVDIAVNRYNTNTRQTETDFFNIVLWDKKAEYFVKYATKGSKVAIVGSLQTRSYTDKNGKTKTEIKIVASDVDLIVNYKTLSKNKTNEEEVCSQMKVDELDEVEEVDEDDLPF